MPPNALEAPPMRTNQLEARLLQTPRLRTGAWQALPPAQHGRCGRRRCSCIHLPPGEPFCQSRQARAGQEIPSCPLAGMQLQSVPPLRCTPAPHRRHNRESGKWVQLPGPRVVPPQGGGCGNVVRQAHRSAPGELPCYPVHGRPRWQPHAQAQPPAQHFNWCAGLMSALALALSAGTSHR